MSYIKKWFKSFHSRTLRVDILWLYLSLFCLAFLCVISITSYRVHKSILQLSIETIERVSSIVQERLKALFIDAEQVPKIAADLFTDINDITPNNPYLMRFIYEAVKYDPNFSGFYIGTEEGNYLGASNVNLSGQTAFVSDPTKSLPEGTQFAFMTVDDSVQPAKITTYYKNADFQTLAEEDTSSFPFDPRKRPWYVGGSKDKGYHWTPIYTFYLEQTLGISASVPIISKSDQRIGVAEIDLAFFQFSQFLAHQKIGKSGSVFVLNEEGKIIVSPHPASSLPQDLPSKVYQEYKQLGQRSFVYTFENVKYLVYINSLTLFKKRQWLITVIVPLSDFLGDVIHTERIILGMAISILILSSLLVVLFSKRISAPIVKLTAQIDRIARFDLENQPRVHSNIKEVHLMDIAIVKLRKAIRSFARYVPKNVVELLVGKGGDVVFGGEKKEITIFFSDIAGFTSIAEEHSAEFVMQFLAAYFDGLIKIILAQQGTVDKFIGDSIMAFWGAPSSAPDHAAKGCIAALLCKKYLLEFNLKQKDAGKQQVETSIILNSGAVIVGNIGTSQRINYSAIGDVINTAAHLRPISKIFHTIIHVTEETYQRLGTEFVVRPLDILHVKGKKNKIKVYELIAVKNQGDEIAPSLEEEELCNSFTEAFEAFHAGELDRAKILFTELSRHFPDDIPIQIYLKRLEMP